MSATVKVRKREHDGRYAFDGDLRRLCVCRHSLAVHSAGSPADCLLYSLPDNDPQRAIEEANGGLVECGCRRFQLSCRKPRNSSPRRRYCPNCRASITDTDVEAGACTQCGVEVKG